MKRTRMPAMLSRLRTALMMGVLLATAIALHPAAESSEQALSRTASSAAPAAKPLWSELSPAQQTALAPLASEWNQLDAFRKSKWLTISNKFATMKPDEQQRIQERMRDWVASTPEQRRIARESYSRTKKLKPDQKSAHWEKYQQLPEDRKKKLAEGATAKKPVATLPRPTTQAKSTIPPIKSAPKPVLEQSVTPQAASHPASRQSPSQPTQ